MQKTQTKRKGLIIIQKLFANFAWDLRYEHREDNPLAFQLSESIVDYNY
jgi:hypothetical protein